MNLIQTKLLDASSFNFADILTIVNPIDFGGHSSKVKIMMGIKLTNVGCAGMLRFALLYFSYCLIFQTFLFYVWYMYRYI